MNTRNRELSEFAMQDPEMGSPAGMDAGGPALSPEPAPEMNTGGGIDREGAMAKADLYKLASYAHKLYQQIEDDQQLEAWIQAKITKAADYIASVYHYLEYEMKFSEYGKHLDSADTLSESQKAALKNRLMEARSMVKQLKVAHAEKVQSQIEEGTLSGGTAPCEACGGTGVVNAPAAQIPAHVKAKAAAYNRQTKAMHAASKRLDKNNNGIPDEEESVNEATKTPTTWTDKSGKKHPATSVKGDKYTGKEAEKESKAKKDQDLEEATKTPTTWTDKSGKKHPATSVKGDKYTGKEAEKEAKKDKDLEEATKTPSTWTDKSGKKHPATQVKGDKYTGKEAEKEAKKDKDLEEATKTPTTWTDKSGKKHPATQVKGDKYTGKEAEKESKSKDLDEGKPSAGLSKAKKSAVVKKAQAGGDIGKPGKGFAKVEKAAKAGGAKDPKAVAAAAMWKNIKEAVKSKKADKDYDGDGKIESGKAEHAGSVDNAIKASKKETVKESVETSRMREQLGRLNRNETHQLVESSEADQIRALTKRLLG